MIVDTSALLAILFQEPEAERIAVALARAEQRALAAPSFLEASILLQARRGDEAVRSLDLLLARFNIEITPFGADQARIARAAFKRFGKGRHKAALNFGDCIAYALARHTGEPLLFKGADFSQTDVAVAPY